MGCNCKNKFKSIEKFSDDDFNEENEDKLNIIDKIIEFSAQFLFGILIGVILIIIMIPFLLYLMFCIMFKKEPSFKLINFNKRFKKDKDNEGK